jgi:hypothetical protein
MLVRYFSSSSLRQEQNMKAIAYSFAVAAVAFSVSGLSIPAFYKRAVHQTKALACFTQ